MEKVQEIETAFSDVEKIKHHLLLKKSWPAILTTDNVIRIEVIKGQFVDKAGWDYLKSKAMLPQEMFDDLESFFTRDWSKFN